MPYTKLHQSLITSTIWREPNHIRVAWITMLAMGDKNGEVLASIPGLADICRITIPQMEEALACFLAPDPYSRTKDHEGRRIVEIDGGWFLLNHPKYRAMASKEDEKEKAAIRQANKRERDGALLSRTVTDGNDGVTQHRDIADADTNADAEAEKTPQPPKGNDYSADFEIFWGAYPRKVSKVAAWKAWKKQNADMQTVPILNHLKARWPNHLTLDLQFVPHPATFLNQRRWEDELPPCNSAAPTKVMRPHTVDDAEMGYVPVPGIRNRLKVS